MTEKMGGVEMRGRRPRETAHPPPQGVFGTFPNAKTKSNEMNKYCSCYYEYIYKCPDFCDGSGNEL